MSNTPRTDAEVFNDHDGCADKVTAKFARSLERKFREANNGLVTIVSVINAYNDAGCCVACGGLATSGLHKVTCPFSIAMETLHRIAILQMAKEGN